MKIMLSALIAVLFAGSIGAHQEANYENKDSCPPDELKLNDQSADYYRHRGFYGRGGRGFGAYGWGPVAVPGTARVVEKLPPIVEEVDVPIVTPVYQDRIKVLHPVERKEVVPGVERTVIGAPRQADPGEPQPGPQPDMGEQPMPNNRQR
jgi:hypothetical protein